MGTHLVRSLGSLFIDVCLLNCKHIRVLTMLHLNNFSALLVVVVVPADIVVVVVVKSICRI